MFKNVNILNYYMGKPRYVPLATSVIVDTRSEIINALSELKKQYDKICDFKVEGPFILSGYASRETFERVDPVGGYAVGPPNAYVGICVDQNILEQHLNPLEKDEKIQETIKELEQRLGIKIILSVLPLRELDGTVIDPKSGIKYMFEDRYALTPQTISR